uniref:hypothetical protein n=1 Tax=Paenarthrobacter ureafaciens TaxID=37931 RepID=UPI003F490630
MSTTSVDPMLASWSADRQSLRAYDRLTKRLICKLLMDSGDQGVERTNLFRQVESIAKTNFPQFDYDIKAFELDLISVQRRYGGIFETVDRHFHLVR